MIYTTYFAKLKKLPEHIVPISIALSSPKWYSGLEYKKLAPSWSILSEYKIYHDESLYIRRFRKEILNNLDPNVVYNELLQLSKCKDIALTCYEKTGDFCHRNIVKSWFNSNDIY